MSYALHTMQAITASFYFKQHGQRAEYTFRLPSSEMAKVFHFRGKALATFRNRGRWVKKKKVNHQRRQAMDTTFAGWGLALPQPFLKISTQRFKKMMGLRGV